MIHDNAERHGRGVGTAKGEEARQRTMAETLCDLVSERLGRVAQKSTVCKARAGRGEGTEAPQGQGSGETGREQAIAAQTGHLTACDARVVWDGCVGQRGAGQRGAGQGGATTYAHRCPRGTRI